jgi:hypothetical protein
MSEDATSNPKEDAGAAEGGGGDTPQEPSEPPAPPAGRETTIEPALQMEVVLLAVSAVREIAAAIAKRVKSCMGEDKGLVLIGDESLLGKLAEWRSLESRIGVLENAMSRLVPSEGLETLSLADVTAEVAGIAKLFSYFQGDTEYAGREVALDASTLYPALVGQLVRAGVGQVVIGGSPGCRVSNGKDLISRLTRLLALKSRLEPLDPPVADPPPANPGEGGPAEGGRRAHPVTLAVEGLLSDVSGEKLTNLRAASETMQLIDESSRAFLLSAKIIKTGGHYRITKGVLAALFGGRLRCSAGTVVGFVLTDLNMMRAADGDALYHATNNVKVRSCLETSSNLV